MLCWTFYSCANYWYLRAVLADSAITWARIICIQYCRHDTCPLPGLAARQSRHSVKLVNLTSPLTTFAKTMQQHVRLIKNLLNSSDFNQRPFQTIIVTRLPLWTSGPWRGKAGGRPPAPASLLRSGVWSMVGRNNKTLSTTVTCPRAAPCPPVLLPHCCKDETKYLNSRRRSVNSC